MPWTDPNNGPAVTGTVAPAALWNTYVKNNMLALPASPALHVPGTGGGFGESWHIGIPVTGGGTMFAATALSGNRVHASPLLCPPGALDRMSFEVTTASGGNTIRHGIYAAVSITDLYPGSLLVDSGTISVGTTGLKTTTINITIEAGKMYWMIIQTSAAGPSVTQHVGATFLVPQGLLGRTTWSTQTDWLSAGFWMSRTDAALPATFPAFAGATWINPLAHGVRYSA